MYRRTVGRCARRKSRGMHEPFVVGRKIRASLNARFLNRADYEPAFTLAFARRSYSSQFLHRGRVEHSKSRRIQRNPAPHSITRIPRGQFKYTFDNIIIMLTYNNANSIIILIVNLVKCGKLRKSRNEFPDDISLKRQAISIMVEAKREQLQISGDGRVPVPSSRRATVTNLLTYRRGREGKHGVHVGSATAAKLRRSVTNYRQFSRI